VVGGVGWEEERAVVERRLKEERVVLSLSLIHDLSTLAAH
jgi:hypothetical protein